MIVKWFSIQSTHKWNLPDRKKEAPHPPKARKKGEDDEDGYTNDITMARKTIIETCDKKSYSKDNINPY